eukprot:8642566-Pyramimonas_sp.AAC.1
MGAQAHPRRPPCPRGVRWDHVLSRARRPIPPATPLPRDVTGGPIQWLEPAPAGAGTRRTTRTEIHAVPGGVPSRPQNARSPRDLRRQTRTTAGPPLEFGGAAPGPSGHRRPWPAAPPLRRRRLGGSQFTPG